MQVEAARNRAVAEQQLGRGPSPEVSDRWMAAGQDSWVTCRVQGWDKPTVASFLVCIHCSMFQIILEEEATCKPNSLHPDQITRNLDTSRSR